MRKVLFSLAFLAGLSLVVLLASRTEDDRPVMVETLQTLEAFPVVNARGESLPLVLPSELASTRGGVVEEQYSIETRKVLEGQVRESAVRAGRACSGRKFDAKACSMWWAKDVTIYDMTPPNGVMRSREEWEARLEQVVKSDPHDEMQIRVESAGFVGHGTNYAWANGFWAKFYEAKVTKQGRYSAIMQERNGAWQFYVVSTIEMDSEADWTPVRNGHGGPLKVAAQRIMTEFAQGFNRRDYRRAFQQYSKHAKFPFLKHLGGESLAFAITQLDEQKQKLSPAHMVAQVDEAKPLGSSGLVAVAHGLQKMTDDDSKIYTMGRFSFLLVMERKTVKDEWKVRYDFSPNNWLLAPTAH